MRLRTRLTVAFVLVAFAAVGLVGLLVNRATTFSFQRYLAGTADPTFGRLVTDLANYYANRGDWNGVEAMLRDGPLGPQAEQGGYFVRVQDERGNVVAARGGQGRRTGDLETAYQAPVVVEGERVGELVIYRAGSGGGAGAQFLDSVNMAIVAAGLLAILLALLLGLILSRRLTQPINQLSIATQAIAGGNLQRRVHVSGDDELAELAFHFNQMATGLAAASEQRQRLLADTAHDLRTPISVIRSHLEAMLDGVFAATPENLSILHDETLHLSRLVDDIRTLSLVESGQLALERRLIEIRSVVKQAVHAFLPLAEADGIVLAFTAVDDAVISADESRLHQVLANLLSNALRYAPQGSTLPPRVTVALQVRPQDVVISIADTGPGIGKEEVAHVFDRFWRGDPARTRQHGGSGLGLAIARGVVEAHGGKIWVESIPGAGATFFVAFPKTSPV